MSSLTVSFLILLYFLYIRAILNAPGTKKLLRSSLLRLLIIPQFSPFVYCKKDCIEYHLAFDERVPCQTIENNLKRTKCNVVSFIQSNRLGLFLNVGKCFIYSRKGFKLDNEIIA